MRREFTAIGALSMLIAFMAGTVVCMQITHVETPSGWEVSALVLWMLEAAIFGTAVYAWRPAVSLVGWVLGIAGLTLVRVGLTAAAAAGLTAMSGGETIYPAMQDAADAVPRVSAILFSAMICYPLRSFLPERAPRRPADARRFAESAAVKSATAAAAAEGGVLIVTVKDRGATVEDESRRAAETYQAPPMPVPDMEGAINLPASAILAQLPREMVTEKALAMADSHDVPIPLEAILGQLREARVVVSIAQVMEWLPSRVRKALVQPAELTLREDAVELPLNLVVTRLPPEALALPPPSPPEWADVGTSEGVVFATTQ
jgi:hypothetical protein